MANVKNLGPNFLVSFLVGTALSFTISCTQGPCRADKPMPVNLRAKKANLQGPPNPMPSPRASASTARNTTTIYKYDGSLQCGMGKAIPVAEMEKELKDIKVISGSKKADGLFHIQVCGQPTGMMNVYEIAEADLSQAESLGFRKWDIN